MVVDQDNDNENGKKELKKVEPTKLAKKLTEMLEKRRELKLTIIIYFKLKYIEATIQ